MQYQRHITFLILASLAVGCGGGSPTPPPPPPAPFRAFGLVIPTQDERQNSPKALDFGAAAGASADLLSTGFMPPIQDQGQVGSCVAFAVGYGLTTYETAKATGQSPVDQTRMASAEDLYDHVLALENSSCGNGTNAIDAFNYLSRVGVQSWAAVPYSATCSNLTAAGGPFALNGYKSLFNVQGTAPDDDQIRQALSAGHPVAIAVQVPSDFSSWGQNPSNNNTVYDSNASLLQAGHMLLIVGFDDSRSAYHVMNSWGTNWGDAGFFWISYNTFDRIAREAYESTAATNIPPVNPVSSVTMQTEANNYFFEGFNYLVMPFQLSEPLYVTTFSVQDPFGNSSGLVPANQWAYGTYVWFFTAPPNFWPDGTYTLTINGQTRDGRNVSVNASAGLQHPFTPFHAPKGTNQLANLFQSSGRSKKESGFAPGTPIIANGVVLHPKAP